MATVPKKSLTASKMLGLALCFSLCLVAGCVSTDETEETKPPRAKPCQVVTTWQPKVIYTPDPANNGAMSPGIAGRFYMFGKEIGHPMAWGGSLTVDLYDITKENGNEPMHLERWHIDPQNLERLLKKDAIGWGYTLFLPWGTHRSDIKHVQMRVKFEPKDGTPLFTQSGKLSVDSAMGGPLPGAQASNVRGNSPVR